MTTNVPQTTDKTPDPALVAPTSYKPSVREMLAELAALIVRYALPDPADVGMTPAGVSIHVRSTTEVDAWAEVMSAETSERVIDHIPHPFWSYGFDSTLIGEAWLHVAVHHHIPSGDELVEQPAAAA